MKPIYRGLCRVSVAALIGTSLLAGCAKSENTGTTSPSGNAAGQQTVATSGAAAGSGCTLQSYGATKIDLKNAIVGFSQSEKEANPFRIAETSRSRTRPPSWASSSSSSPTRSPSCPSRSATSRTCSPRGAVHHRGPAQLQWPRAGARGGRRQEGPGPHDRPQAHLHAVQGLPGLPRLQLRRAGQTRCRRDDQGHRWNGQGRDPARLLW